MTFRVNSPKDVHPRRALLPKPVVRTRRDVSSRRGGGGRLRFRHTPSRVRHVSGAEPSTSADWSGYRYQLALLAAAPRLASAPPGAASIRSARSAVVRCRAVRLGRVPPSRAVLITGCSSGIGHATAERLLAGGWKVYATARRPESIADLADKGAITLALDVTDEASMARRGPDRDRGRRRGRGAGQQRRLQPVGRGRVGADRPGPPAVRDQRVRADPDVPAGAARHARAGLGQDRERRLDGRDGSPSRAAASTTPPNTRSRRSATRCASRSAASAST